MIERDGLDLLAEAKTAYKQGDLSLAESLLGRLVLTGTKNPEVFQLLAIIYHDRGQFSKAIKTFKRALEIDPSFTDASVGLSILLNDLGKYEEAKKVFLEAERILQQKRKASDPFLDEKIASKHIEVADLYLRAQRIREALEEFQKAMKLSSRRAEIGLQVAECYTQLGDDEKAIQTLKQLIKEYPNFLTARMRLGNLFYQMQRLVEATQMWESVLARDPHHAEAQKRLKTAQAVGVTELGSESRLYS